MDNITPRMNNMKLLASQFQPQTKEPKK
jgi:hypothetical protein